MIQHTIAENIKKSEVLIEMLKDDREFFTNMKATGIATGNFGRVKEMDYRIAKVTERIESLEQEIRDARKVIE